MGGFTPPNQRDLAWPSHHDNLAHLNPGTRRELSFPEMTTETLVHIVPTVPPAFNGLADYSYKLWEHWPQPRPQWKCLSVDIPPGTKEVWPEAQIVSFELSKRGLLDELKRAAPDCVILHYVGYAYHPKGVPLWLPAALRDWKAHSNGRLCVMFHELYASGSPRQSAFWLQPWSKKIVANLVGLSDEWFCSSELAAEVLVSRFAAVRERGRVVPVGANIEPAAPVDFERHWPLAHGEKLRVVAFGLPGTRAAAVESHQNLLKLLCARDLVEEIALVGKSGDTEHDETMRALQEQIAPAARAQLWTTHFDLAPPQISALLNRYDLSLSRDWPQLLTKSGSYAAATVHGLISVCAPRASIGTPGFKLDPHRVFDPPFVANDDADAAQTLKILSDAEAIGTLKHRVCAAAQGDLNWTNIVREWKRATDS